MGMKAHKKHEEIKDGKVYVGGYMNRRKKARTKIGTTEEELKKRVSNIRCKYGKDFDVFAYIKLTTATKARLELIESWVREGLESKYNHVENDHFEFAMLNRTEGYERFTRDAITLAVEICNIKHWDYTVIHTK